MNPRGLSNTNRVPASILISILTVVLFILIHVLSAIGQEEKKKDVWKGKLADGATITEGDLSKILEEHKKWIDTDEKEGKRADLNGAFLYKAKLSKANLSRASLYKANLSMANLSMANLSEANLSEAILNEASLMYANLSKANLSRAGLIGANLSKANLSEASLSGASLKYANLSEAILSEAILYKADLYKANLSKANLSRAGLIGANLSEAILYKADLNGADLNGADLNGANLKKANATFVDFSGSYFEPKNIEELVFLGAKGLSSIRFKNFKPVVDLRKMAKEAGLRNEERALTAVLRKYRLSAMPKLERIFEYFFLDLPTDSGANPWRSLEVLGLLIVVFSIPYMIVLRRSGKDGIWKLWIPERVRKDLGEKEPTRLILRGFAILRIGFYFSVLSAFSIGWRELNVGNWIARIQRREYTLRASGWARTLSGIQSLLSVYLLALWVLTYFGRPFG